MSLIHRVRSTLADAFDPGAPGLPGFAALLALVAAAPYPWGGVLPAGTLRIELLAFLAAALAYLPSPSGAPLGAARLPVAAAVGVAVLGALQLVPLPESILARIAPASVQVYRETADVLRAAHAAPAALRVSIAPADTAATAVLALAYASAFCAAARLLALRARRRVFLVAVVLAALVQIAAGTLSDEAQAAGRLHASFLNPDHLAGYLEVSLALAFGVVWAAIRAKAGRGEDAIERRLSSVAAAVLLWGTLAAGIGLTKSRGGILAAGTTAVLLLVLSLVYRRKRSGLRTAAAGWLVLAVGVLFALLITREGPLLRFLADDPRDIGADTRVRIWSASLEAFRGSPVVGTGLGTFREAFRRVQPHDLPGLVEQAHDDFLQMLVTGGVVGALLAALAMAGAALLLLRGWLKQERREERMLALSAFGAVVSLALHGVVDFNLSLPATAVTLCAVAGAGWAAASARNETRSGSGRAPAST